MAHARAGFHLFEACMTVDIAQSAQLKPWALLKPSIDWLFVFIPATLLLEEWLHASAPLIFFSSAILLSAAPALACSCVLQTVAQAKQAAAAIFEGRVTSIVDAPVSGADMNPERSVTLSVVRSWRSLENQETVTLRTAKSGATCGYAFEIGTSYLVYAGGEPGKLLVNSCSRTRLLSEASEDLAALGGGVTPSKVEPTQDKRVSAPPKSRSGGGCASASGRAGASAASPWWLGAPGIILFAQRRYWS
jgi:hypothetical protein